MIILLTVFTVILFLTVTKTQFIKRKHSNNKFMTQIGMAVLVAIVTISIYFISNENMALKYTAFGIGLMSFISILIDMIILKSKQTQHNSN